VSQNNFSLHTVAVPTAVNLNGCGLAHDRIIGTTSIRIRDELF
jgi:hypothetical protein